MGAFANIEDEDEEEDEKEIQRSDSACHRFILPIRNMPCF
jgi:hypothetical protein